MPQTLVQAPRSTYMQNMQRYQGMLNAAGREYAKALKGPKMPRGRKSRRPSSMTASEKNAMRKAEQSARSTERQQANIMRREKYDIKQVAQEEQELNRREREQAIDIRERGAAIEEERAPRIAQSEDLANKLSNIERMQRGIEHATTFLPKVQQDTYDDWLAWIGEEQWAPADVFMPPDQVAQMAPEEFEMYKSSLANNMRTKDDDKQFAPDIKERRNAETGEMLRIDERNPFEVQQAEHAGFKPVGPRFDAFLKGEGKAAAIAFDTITSDAKKARQSIATLKTMDSLLDRFESGKLTNITKNIQQWGASLGLPIDTANLSSKEAFLAFANQLALQSRNLGEGMVLAGQMSDQDVKFLKDMNPQLVISKGGNRLIVKIRQRLARRRSDAAKLAYGYKKKNKGYFDPLEFENYVRAKLANKNVFGIPDGAIKVGQDKNTGLPVYELDGKFISPDI